MDFVALETDVTTALKRLPPDMLSVISKTILTNFAVLTKELPNLIEELKPHIMAGMVEMSCSMLDMKELEATLLKCLGKFGVDMPPMVPTPDTAPLNAG